MENHKPTFYTLQQHGITHVTILHNPGERYKDAFNGVLHEFASAESEIQIIQQATNPSYEKTLSSMQEIFNRENSSAFLVVGGDGTVNTGLRIAEETGKPIGLIAAGKTNDIARQTNNRKTLKDPSLLITEPVLFRNLHGLKLRVSSSHEAIVEDTIQSVPDMTILTGYGYASLGLSAHVAERLNNPSYRNHISKRIFGNWIADRVMTAYASLTVDHFHLKHNGHSRHRPTLEKMIANGNWMGGTLRPQADLFKRESSRIITSHSRLGAWAITGALIAGLAIGEKLHEPDNFDANDNNGMRLQVDGECMSFDGQLNITIQHADTPASVITPPGKLGSGTFLHHYKPSRR